MPLIAAIVLGPTGRQRFMVLQTLLTFGTYLFLAVLQEAEVRLGLVDSFESNALTAFYLSGSVVFYLLVRTGGARAISADPSLTLHQAYFAVFCAAVSYSISGPTRGGVMTLLVLLIAFAMFGATPAQSRWLAAFAFLSLSVVMAWKSQTDPARYPPRAELILFIWTGIVAVAMSILAGRMGRLRMRLSSQKAELQRALDRIEAIAIRDELTGLFSRRHMRTLIEQARALQLRDGSAFSVALFDIDRFKHLNDTHGHHAGDEALKRFAACMQESTRGTDVLARWGGEEFLMLLPQTSAEAALAVVERMRERLAETSFDDIAPGVKVTFSAGLADSAAGDATDTIVERADQAMYLAKNSGRDRSMLSSPGVSSPALLRVVEATDGDKAPA